MDIKNIKIDTLGSTGGKMLLVDVVAAYAYAYGHRTNTISGYKYTVVLEERFFDKLSVRIDGDKQMDKPVDGNGRIYVHFDNLELSLFWTPSGHQVSAKASGIHLANESSKLQK